MADLEVLDHLMDRAEAGGLIALRSIPAQNQRTMRPTALLPALDGTAGGLASRGLIGQGVTAPGCVLIGLPDRL